MQKGIEIFTPDENESTGIEYSDNRVSAGFPSPAEHTSTVKLDLNGEKEVDTENNFVSLLVLSGEITVKYDGGEISAQKGGSILVPHGVKASVCGNAEVIYTK